MALSFQKTQYTRATIVLSNGRQDWTRKTWLIEHDDVSENAVHRFIAEAERKGFVVEIWEWKFSDYPFATVSEGTGRE